MIPFKICITCLLSLRLPNAFALNSTHSVATAGSASEGVSSPVETDTLKIEEVQAPATGTRKAKVLYDYDAADSSELSLLADEVRFHQRPAASRVIHDFCQLARSLKFYLVPKNVRSDNVYARLLSTSKVIHTAMVKGLHQLVKNMYTMAVRSSNGFYSSHFSAMNEWNTNYLVTRNVCIYYVSSVNVSKSAGSKMYIQYFLYLVKHPLAIFTSVWCF